MTEGVPNIIEQLAKKRLKRPDISTLASVILDPIGGLKGLADEIWGEYQAAQKGSNNRALLLRALVDIVKVAGNNSPGDSFDEVPTEELEAGVVHAQRMLSGGK